MFAFTDDPFIYNEKYITNGICLFYYNGVIPSEQSASLFSGFNGTREVSDVLKNLDGFYMKYHASAIPASLSDNLEEVLREFTGVQPIG